MLWAVCQVPDYRKLLPELHAELLSEVFERLTQDDGQLDDDWMERRVAPLDATDGDIDALTHRLAFIRTWTYLSQHSAFVRSAKDWRERTRAIEDRLSDALHDLSYSASSRRIATRLAYPKRARTWGDPLGRSNVARTPEAPKPPALRALWSPRTPTVHSRS